MRILLISGVYPPNIGGPSAQTEQLARGLLSRGVDVRVLTFGDPGQSGSVDGIPVTFIERAQTNGAFGKLARELQTYRRVARELDDFRPQVVHVQTIGGALPLWAGMAARRRRIPALLRYTADFTVEMSGGAGLGHETAPSWRKRLWLAALGAVQKTMLRLYDSIWVTTPLFRDHLAHKLRVPAKKLMLHPNCVDLRAFEAVAAQRTTNTDEPTAERTDAVPIVLLTVARLVPLKGLDVFIEALAQLQDLPVKLRIAGSGTDEYEKHLRLVADRFGVAGRIEFLGKIPPDKISEIYRSADFFVLPSHYEPFGIVLLEAMAAGLPIVATNVGGIPAVVDDGISARLVPPGDPKAIADAVRGLIQDPPAGMRLVEAAKERTRQFAFTGLLDKLAGAYASLAGQSGRAVTKKTHLNGSRVPGDKLSILSFGYTRGLWEGPAAEDVQRLTSYAEHLDEYVVVTNSYKGHGLKELRLASNLEAIPTDAFNPLHSFWRMLRIGRTILRQRRISLIQAQDPFGTGLVAVALGKLFRVPVNVCIFGPNVYDRHWLASHWSHRFYAPIGRWVLRRCAGVQIDGRMTARSLIAAGIPSERVALKPVVPANLESFLAIERSAKNSTPRLIFVGRLAPQKNLPMLIEVAQQLKAKGCAFELSIVGDGPQAQELRTDVERRGLSAEVIFHKAVPRERIADVFRDADIFVLTSDYEGYPRVLMEAAAAAMPVVTTAVSGSDEAVIDGETGFIVPVRDSQAVAEKLALLIESADLRLQMGLAARQSIRTNLDPRRNTPAQLAIWKKVAAPRATTPRRLLLFNLVTDVKHPILGFTSQWIRALASRVESIDVITMRAGEIDLPPNVRVFSAGAEHGYSKPRRMLNFYRHLFRILLTRRIDGCFSHMMPEFSGIGGPVLRACRIPLVTWYAHPKLTLPVRVAHFFSNRMVTSLDGAYPHRKDKLTVIGQGIDTDLFAPSPDSVEDPRLVLCVGRLSRVKNHPVLLRAFAALPAGYRLAILGATAGPEDEANAQELRALAAELGIAGAVTFEKPVPSEQLPAHYRRCAAHINLTPAGFGDKVAWEAMSCARPCLVANTDFRETLGGLDGQLLFKLGDSADLAAKLRAILEKTPAERAEIGAVLREQVKKLHSLPQLADRILNEIARCRARRAQP